MMTRKDFEFISRVLRESKPKEEDYINGKAGEDALASALATWGSTCFAFSHALQAENPRFSRSLFLKACQL